MGLQFNQYLDGCGIYGCKLCKTHLAAADSILSKSFRGRQGEAYLFKDVVNIKRGHKEERNMLTGKYIVQDIACRHCEQTVGWTYVKAYDDNEAYKEGKFILEVKVLAQVP